MSGTLNAPSKNSGGGLSVNNGMIAGVWIDPLAEGGSELRAIRVTEDGSLVTSSSGGVAAGISTSEKQDSQIFEAQITNESLLTIIAELRNDRQIAETVWYDRKDPTLFYVRRATVDESTGDVTISFQNADGSDATPTIANLVQATSQNELEPVSYNYKAITNSGDYNIGNVIQELQLVDTQGNITVTIWLNRTTGLQIAPPFFGDLQTDTLQATAALQTNQLTQLTTLNTKFSTLGQKTSTLSTPVVLASDQSDLNPNRTLATSSFSKITDGANTATVKPASTTALSTDSALVITSREAYTGITDTQLRATPVNQNIAQIAGATTSVSNGVATVGTQRVTIASDNLPISNNITLVNGVGISLAAKTTALSLPVTLPTDIADIYSNRTLATAAFSKITDGTNTATVKPASVLALPTDSAVVVTLRESASAGLTDTQLRATPVNQNVAQVAGVTTSVSNGVATAGTLRVAIASDNSPISNNITLVNGVGISLAAKTTALSLPVTLPTDVADINPNRSLTTAAFAKITDGTNTATVKPASVLALPTDSAVVVTLRESATAGLTDTQLRATPVNQNIAQIAGVVTSVNNGIATPGTQRVVIASDNLPISNNITLVNGVGISLAAKTTALSLPVTLPTDVADINPNRSLTTAAFAKITDGTNTATVKPASVLALPTDSAVVVTLRESATAGLTDTQLRATPVNQNVAQVNGLGVATGNGVSNASVLRVAVASDNLPIPSDITLVSGVGITLGAKPTTQSFPVTLPTDVVDINSNRTLVTAAFSKVTDGTNTAAVRPTQPVNTDSALVVSLGANSTNFAPLTASTVATRQSIVGGVAIGAGSILGLAVGQQYPLRLTPNASLVVSTEITAISNRVGGINPSSDISLQFGNNRIRNILFTNNSATVLYIQYHNSVSALVNLTSIPYLGQVYRVPANATFSAGVGEYGEVGTTVAPFPRVAISNTFNFYSIPAPAVLAACSLSVAVV